MGSTKIPRKTRSMRRIFNDRPAPFAEAVRHRYARELEAISKLLDEQPRAARLVHADLTRHGLIDATRGREGMSAEQVLRVAVLRQIQGDSYEDLAFRLEDSATCRAFCRFDSDGSVPSKSTLHRNVKALSLTTLQSIHAMLVHCADEEGVEDGEAIRVDCSTVKAPIHPPSDSSLLWDSARVLARLMKRAKEWSDESWTNHSRQAKRRYVAIHHARNEQERQPLYRDLLRAVEQMIADAERVAASLEQAGGGPPSAPALALAQRIRHHIELGRRVVEQTRRRVQLGETVPASDKLVSIFEPHTDIIVKDRRETLYGHKVRFGFGASGLISSVRIVDGNPADSTLAVDAAKQEMKLHGRAPKQMAFDGAFASKSNLADLQKLGVEDVAFSRHRGIAIEDMTGCVRTFRKLRNFRAGAEACISFLKRTLGLGRCLWRSLPSFHAYVWLAIIAANLMTIARRMFA
jgi:transposase, IS5 family